MWSSKLVLLLPIVKISEAQVSNNGLKSEHVLLPLIKNLKIKAKWTLAKNGSHRGWVQEFPGSF